MRIFGLTITRGKAAVAPMGLEDFGLTRPSAWTRIFESFAGAWQRNVEVTVDSVLTYGAVYACINLIATDIAKLRVKLVELDADGIWNEVSGQSPFLPVLRKPNHYQTRIDMLEQWVMSKLIHGNAYVLKERDRRGVVTGLYPLDPNRVKVLVATDGSVYYSLSQDDLSGVTDAMAVVPAREIIHDRIASMFHPLVGISPITACGLAAMQGLSIQANSTRFFKNGSKPGGVLTAPGVISKETQKRLEESWEQNYGGDNYGRVAVLGDGLKYEPMAMTNVDAQMIDQLGWTAENVCTAFKVPPYMVGVGASPTYNNIEALNQQYYSQCLQTHLERIELLLDEGLGLDAKTGTEFDLDGLMRMDTSAAVKAATESVTGGLMKPNEARKRWFNLGPVAGGDAVYLQQQNFSLSALAKRDAKEDPFATSKADPAASPAPAEPAAAKHLSIAHIKAMAANRLAQLLEAA